MGLDKDKQEREREADAFAERGVRRKSEAAAAAATAALREARARGAREHWGVPVRLRVDEARRQRAPSRAPPLSLCCVSLARGRSRGQRARAPRPPVRLVIRIM